MRAALVRVLCGAAVAGLVLVAGVATPAHADSGFATTQFDAETLSVLPSPGKAMTMYVYGSNAKNPVVTIDPAGLGAEATLDTPSGCTAAADHKVSCAFPTVDSLFTTMTLVIHPTAQAVAGDTLHVATTMATDNLGTSTITTDIPVTDAIDLVASPRDTENTTPVQPGDHVTMKANVSNEGSQPVQGVRMTVLSDHSLVPDQYDNCVYGSVATYLHQFVCDLPNVALNPGDGFVIHDEGGNDLGFTVGSDASGSAGAQFTFDILAGAPALQPQKRTRSGHRLSLSRSVPAAQASGAVDPNPYDNFGEVFWNLAGIHRNVSAIGAVTTAKVGDTVTVDVGMVDHGPAALDAMRSGGDPAFYFVFQPPAYADVVSIPQSCESIVDIDGVQYGTPGAPHGRYYRCGTGDFVPVGVPQTVRVSMRITGSTGVPGQLTFYDKYVDPQYAFHDDNAADDDATVAVTVLRPVPAGGQPTTWGSPPAPSHSPVGVPPFPTSPPPAGRGCRVGSAAPGECVFPSGH